mgnify:CR=1 FL=1
MQGTHFTSLRVEQHEPLTAPLAAGEDQVTPVPQPNRLNRAGALRELLAAARLEIVECDLKSPSDRGGEGDLIRMDRIPHRLGAIAADIGRDPARRTAVDRDRVKLRFTRSIRSIDEPLPVRRPAGRSFQALVRRQPTPVLAVRVGELDFGMTADGVSHGNSPSNGAKGPT